MLSTVTTQESFYTGLHKMFIMERLQMANKLQINHKKIHQKIFSRYLKGNQNLVHW